MSDMKIPGKELQNKNDEFILNSLYEKAKLEGNEDIVNAVLSLYDVLSKDTRYSLIPEGYIIHRGGGRKKAGENSVQSQRIKEIALNRMTIEQIMREYHVSQATAYRLAREAGTIRFYKTKKDEAKVSREDDDVVSPVKEEEVLSNIRKSRSFTMSDTTYQRLLDYREENGNAGTISSFLSNVIDNLPLNE